MSAATLDFRLRHGSVVASMAEYQAAWRHDEIIVTLNGMAQFADSPSLLNKVRGALGWVLLDGASPGVLARRGCDWPRTCAAELFFGRRPLLRVGDHDSEMAKPFVLFAQRGECGGLLIGARLFGLARAATSAFVEALVRALRQGVRWDQLLRDAPGTVPLFAGLSVSAIEDQAARTIPPGPMHVQFQTPVSAERGDLALNPSLLAGLVCRRLALIAPWHGLEAASTFASTRSVLASAMFEAEEHSTAAVRRGGHRLLGRVSLPPIIRVQGAENNLPFMLAALAHIGRGASIGQGRMTLAALNEAVTCPPLVPRS